METLHDRSDEVAPPQSGESEIESRGASFDYIEQMEPKKIKDDITEQVRRNPGKSLLVASAVGLILGAIFRRK